MSDADSLALAREALCDRGNEAVAAREVARAGVSPEVLHFDNRSGIMLTRFIAGTETMSPQKPSASCKTAAPNSRSASSCSR